MNSLDRCALSWCFISTFSCSPESSGSAIAVLISGGSLQSQTLRCFFIPCFSCVRLVVVEYCPFPRVKPGYVKPNNAVCKVILKRLQQGAGGAQGKQWKTPWIPTRRACGQNRCVNTLQKPLDGTAGTPRKPTTSLKVKGQDPSPPGRHLNTPDHWNHCSLILLGPPGCHGTPLMEPAQGKARAENTRAPPSR